jgi:hypothetical protein
VGEIDLTRSDVRNSYKILVGIPEGKSWRARKSKLNLYIFILCGYKIKLHRVENSNFGETYLTITELSNT